MVPPALVGWAFDSLDPMAWLILAGLIGATASAVTAVLLSRRPTPTPPQPLDRAMRKGFDPFVQGSRTERRTALRRSGPLVEVQLRDAEAREERGTAWVVDRSMGGVALAVEEPFLVGEVLSIRAREAPDVVPWVPVEVRGSRRKNGRCEMGCRFVRQPTWNVLMLFG